MFNLTITRDEAVSIICGRFATSGWCLCERDGGCSSISRQVKEGGATVERYGEKAGVVRACRGNCVTVCKRITYPSPQRGEGTVQSVNAADRYVVVSDGERTIMVKASQVDWRTGAIKTK